AVVGAERLAQISARSAQVLNRIKNSVSGVVRIGRKVDNVAQSQGAFSRAVSAIEELAENFKNKTVAADGDKTLSGWKGKQNPRPSGYRDVSPEDVRDYSELIGHELKNGGANDQVARGGFRGKYYASHAEKQLAVARPNEPIGVSRPMCADCQRFFSRLARYQERPQIVTDPDGTRIFYPDGTVSGP
ncbi:MAG: hypothetical protein ACK5NT_03195, partial [Pyrinomonadaceae bacterium]